MNASNPRKRKKALSCIIGIILLSISAEIATGEMTILASSIKSIRPRDADLNIDGLINTQDFYTFETYIGLCTSHTNWNPKADINADGCVNVLDIILAATMFGKRHALTHSVAYVPTFTDENAAFVASNFDVVLTGFGAVSTIGKIKALNPNIIILGYRSVMSMTTYLDDWLEADAHEDWFLHDVSGNRLQIAWESGWYGMDVGNPGWREHFANYVKNMLETYPDLDGIFADNAWDWEAEPYRYDVWNVPEEELPLDIASGWHNDMLEMITLVKETIGDKLLIINTVNNADYVDACDGKTFEHFVHKTTWELDYYGPPDFDPLKHVEALVEVSKRGKIFLAHSGAEIPDNPTQNDLDKANKVMLYCFAAYLLGVNGEKTTFGFNNIHSKDGSRGYYPEFDISLGSPIGGYYLIGSVFARDFTDGRVLVNPTTSSYTTNLEVEYKTLDGQVVSNVTLTPHSSIILLGS